MRSSHFTPRATFWSAVADGIACLVMFAGIIAVGWFALVYDAARAVGP